MPRLRYWLSAALLAVIGLSAPSTAQDSKDAKDKKAEDKAKDAPPPPPAAAGEKVEFKWKFEKDKPFYQTMTTKTNQEMKVMGMEVKQTQEQTFDFSWTFKEEDKDKNSVIVQKIEGVKLKIDIAGNPISYDSSNQANANNALADFFKALIGTEFKLTLDKNMKVIKVEGREEFLKKLATANQQMEPLLKKILSEEAVKQMADPTFGMVPAEAVAKGGTWKREGKLNLGPIGSYKNNVTYTLEGTDKDIAKIKVDTSLTYDPPTEGGEGLPFKIKEAKLTSKNPKGSVTFDVKKGRLESSNQELELEGTLDIEIGGIATKVELKQKQETSVKTSDAPPKKG
ncbi:MAG: DUF6263 family protein [Gemmataceae bacterium]